MTSANNAYCSSQERKGMIQSLISHPMKQLALGNNIVFKLSLYHFIHYPYAQHMHDYTGVKKGHATMLRKKSLYS